MSKKVVIAISVVFSVVVLAGLGVLIWWLVSDSDSNEIVTIILEGEGFKNVSYTAAFTRIPTTGEIFWWFFPSKAGVSKPILLFLGSITGLPHSFLLNFGEIGPLDFDLNARNDSLVNDYSLLFIDGIVGTGFSKPEETQDSINVDKLVDNLVQVLHSFYNINGNYNDAPLYIYEQGDGSHLAVPLTIRLANDEIYSNKLKGLFLGNPIIAPALVLTKLGFYLEELAMIDGHGRIVTEEFSNSVNSLVSEQKLEEAFDQFITLGTVINNNAGSIAANLGRIVEKLTPESERDYFGQNLYYERVVPSNIDMKIFMETVIAPSLGMSGNVDYDKSRNTTLYALRSIYMENYVDKVEQILNTTSVTVTLFNGNLDAVANTPGQLEWINNLKWPGNTNFTEAARQTLIINRQVEGYFRESSRLNFYWINVAGQSTLLDNPVATKKMLERITRLS
ncbi:serine carboxypeptidase-like 51 [Pieris brassicae]|uniref:serine carboxypeptidase-like 51 n=1 Tax=Pieris brassicae TaxID=7116 RepID=UPI001E661645|nr:serine carboxypeptidase-like 51 [Pieris brassicae]